MTVAIVAWDLLREAAARKWFIALGIGITLVLALLASALRLEVVDGALAATRLFGTDVGGDDIQSVDVALRPVFRAASYLIFYGGLCSGILACADFGPALLAPGRVEFMIAQPVRRWQLLLGTFAGVVTLATLGALYGAGGLTLILGVKTGAWTGRPVVAALLACVTFSALYAVMLATAVFVRSSALSAVVGGGLLAGGVISGYRTVIARGMELGLGRTIFELATWPLPRISAVADRASDLAASTPIDTGVLLRLLTGVVLFGFGALCVAAWRFEQRDF